MRCRKRRGFKTPLFVLSVVLFCVYSASYVLFSDKENKPRRLAMCQPYPACMDNTNADLHDSRGVQREISSNEFAKETEKSGDLKWTKDTLQIVDAARHNDYKRIKDILRKHDMKADENRISKVDNHVANRNGVPTSVKIGVNFSAPGEMGKPFIVSPADQAEADRLFPINSFNLFASDRISLNRTLPDLRSDGCSDLKYPTTLLDTSVVIIFHNEAWSTLWRTVHSVINRSPAYLKEVILVDDASTQDHLKSQLDEYARRLTFSVRIIRFAQRVGSIQAKQMGLESAVGEIVMFLDSHCEVFEGWLEPLVFRIAQNRSNVVQPVIDNINDVTFAVEPYPKPPPQGVFSWELNFGWLYVRETVLMEWKNNNTIPLKSAAMAGGVFAISESFFNDLGGYDEGFKIWGGGGDQMDLSFKTWMCGGTLETLPCSHVGHIERYHNKPYKDHNEGNYQSKNDKRIAEIWMEPEYKDFFYYMRPDAQQAEMDDISKSVQIRQKCKSFGWYLENVFLETSWPTKHSIFGQIKNLQSGYCFNYEHQGDILLSLQPCQAKGIHNREQLWAFTDRGEIKHNHICLDSSGVGNIATPLCHFRGGNQKWSYINKTNRIVHTTGHCLDALEHDGIAGTWMLTVSECNPGKPSQDWRLQMKPWKEWYKDYEQSREQLTAKQFGQE